MPRSSETNISAGTERAHGNALENQGKVPQGNADAGMKCVLLAVTSRGFPKDLRRVSGTLWAEDGFGDWPESKAPR